MSDKPNYDVIIDAWITHWNNRDLAELVKMIKPNSSFALINSYFSPIYIDNKIVTKDRYLIERLKRDFDLLDQSSIKFENPYKRQWGDYFFDIRYNFSTGEYCHDIVRLEDNGLIDQINRSISSFDSPF